MYALKLIVDGAPETLPAAEFAIELATLFDRRLIGTAFVSSREILRATGYNGAAGLCGSGVFLSAYESMIKIMTEVNQTLMDVLTARAGGRDVDVEQKIYESEPLDALMETASAGDFYILGGHETNLELARKISDRTKCPVGVLVVSQGEAPQLLLIADETAHSELMSVLRGMPIRLTRWQPDEFRPQASAKISARAA